MLSPIPSPIPFPKQWHWNRAHCIILYPKLKKEFKHQKSAHDIERQYFPGISNITVLFFPSKLNINWPSYYKSLLVLANISNTSRWLDNIVHMANEIPIKHLLSLKDVVVIIFFLHIRNVSFKYSKILNPIMTKYMKRRYCISYEK